MKIITAMELNFNITQSPQEIESKKDDWYDHCSLALDVLVQKDMMRKLNKLIIYHMIESLRFPDILKVINYLETKVEFTPLEQVVKDYFTSKEMTNNGITGIQLQDTETQKLIMQVISPRVWTAAQSEDYVDLRDNIQSMTTNIIPASEK